MQDDRPVSGNNSLRADARFRTARPRRSWSGWLIIGLPLYLAAAGTWALLTRTQHAARPVDPSAGLIAPPPDLQPLYAQYGMTPLDPGLLQNPRLLSLLSLMRKEPCDHQDIASVAGFLESHHAAKDSERMVAGFAASCPESDGELYHAAELAYLTGDFERAIARSTVVISHMPDMEDAYFLRAKAEQAEHRDAAAISDFGTILRTSKDPKMLVAAIFTRMSDSFVRLNQPCAAVAPLQMYMALDSAHRTTPPLLHRIAALAEAPGCTLAYAKGSARIPLKDNGDSIVSVTVNGASGTFLVDTAAAFVTLSPRFAARAKPRIQPNTQVNLRSAAGSETTPLQTVDSIRFGGLSATAVPAVVSRKGVSPGLDGLLGMSLLSRFTIRMENHEMRISPKPLDP